MNALIRQLGAECFGTFALVFTGTGAIIVNDLHGGTITHVGIALTFGLIVLAMIYAIGDISGAHLNPAVTIGFLASRRLKGSQVVPYILSQILGALLASITLRLMFPSHALLGASLPAASSLQSFLMEYFLSLLLMFVILNVSTGAKEKGLLAGVAVGSVIALEAMFGGPVSGASMNPARSLAPALISCHFESLWIYIFAPILGALSSVILCRMIRDKGGNSPSPSLEG